MNSKLYKFSSCHDVMYRKLTLFVSSIWNLFASSQEYSLETKGSENVELAVETKRGRIMRGYWQESYWAMSLGLSCVDLIENCGDLPPSSAAPRFNDCNPRRINQTGKNCLQWQGVVGLGVQLGELKWWRRSECNTMFFFDCSPHKMLALQSIVFSIHRHGCNFSFFVGLTLQTKLFQPQKTHFGQV